MNANDAHRYSYENVDGTLVKMAIKELNENTDQVWSHIESLRRWLKSMPHIKNCRQGELQNYCQAVVSDSFRHKSLSRTLQMTNFC